MCVTLSNEVLNVNSSGTDVVLARFPVEGETLTSFGLTPSVIKSIAIPNDIQEWPTTALNGCIALEKITVFGEEVQNGSINLTQNHGLYNLSSLASLHFPSTVKWINEPQAGVMAPIFPKNLKTVYFSSEVEIIGYRPFLSVPLTTVNFSYCSNLKKMGLDAFRGTSLRTLDLSTSKLTEIGDTAFTGCNVRSVIFPPSLTKIGWFVFVSEDRSRVLTVQTVIWKGRTDRSNMDINTAAFEGGTPLDTLVSSGRVTEIFIP